MIPTCGLAKSRADIFELPSHRIQDEFAVAADAEAQNSGSGIRIG
jgi:hypothetical protein